MKCVCRPSFAVLFTVLLLPQAALVVSSCAVPSEGEPEPIIVPAAPESAAVDSPRGEQPSWQRPGAFWRWTWPRNEDFRGVWETWGDQTHPWRVVMGSVRLATGEQAKEVVLLMAPRGRGFTLRAHWTSRGAADISLSEYLAGQVWSLESGQRGLLAAGQTVMFTAEAAETRTLQVNPSYVEPAGAWHAAAFDDWVYTTTLLTYEPPVHRPLPLSWQQDEVSQERGRTLWGQVLTSISGVEACGEEPCEASLQARVAVQALFESEDVSRNGGSWGVLLDYARELGDQKMIMGVYQRWRPVGRCSMDTRPRALAQGYAALCEERGRLGCYVQLGVQVLADSFNRVAYSSWAERTNSTGIQALADAGLDTERLLRGLTMTFPTSLKWPVESNLSRVARAALEVEDETPLAEHLEARSQDPALDDMNRLHAAITLGLILQRSAAAEGVPLEARLEDTRQHMRRLDLPPIAALWLEGLGAD